MSEKTTRARTIDGAAEYFYVQDPDTALTKTAIRSLLTSGRVPCSRVGNKYLVTIEALEAWLQGELPQNEEANSTPCIRRVEG